MQFPAKMRAGWEDFGGRIARAVPRTQTGRVVPLVLLGSASGVRVLPVEHGAPGPRSPARFEGSAVVLSQPPGPGGRFLLQRSQPYVSLQVLDQM